MYANKPPSVHVNPLSPLLRAQTCKMLCPCARVPPPHASNSVLCMSASGALHVQYQQIAPCARLCEFVVHPPCGHHAPSSDHSCCLGPNTAGDDIKPEQMRAFLVPKGKGVYFHPGTWHNGVYVAPANTPARFLTRQGKVHARVSASW